MPYLTFFRSHVNNGWMAGTVSILLAVAIIATYIKLGILAFGMIVSLCGGWMLGVYCISKGYVKITDG